MPRILVLIPSGGGGSVANGTLTSAGAATAAFTGAALDATTLTSAGAGTASFVGAALKASTLTSAGAGSASFVGAIAGSSLTAAGAGTASFVGASQAAGTLTSAGAGTASLVGAPLAAGTLTSSGVGAGAFVGASVLAGQTTLAAAGAATVAFAGASIAAAALASSGEASARFTAPQAANDASGGWLEQAAGRRRRRDEYEFLDPYRWRVDPVEEPEQAQAAQKVIRKRVKTLEGWKADLADPARLEAARQATDLSARDVQRWIDEYHRIAAIYRDREIAMRLEQETERRQAAARAARRERQDIEFLLLAA